jgi:hypothetical protein
LWASEFTWSHAVQHLTVIEPGCGPDDHFVSLTPWFVMNWCHGDQ